MIVIRVADAIDSFVQLGQGGGDAIRVCEIVAVQWITAPLPPPLVAPIHVVDGPPVASLDKPVAVPLRVTLGET